MHQGDSDRVLAEAGIISRRKVAAIRRVAEADGWLDWSQSLPDHATLDRIKYGAVDSYSMGKAAADSDLSKIYLKKQNIGTIPLV